MLSIFFVAGIFFLKNKPFSQENGSTIVPIHKDGETVDKRGERHWKEIEISAIQLQSEINDSLYNGMIMHTYLEEIYINDYADTYTKRFDFRGNLLQKYGYGPGQGPGEIGQVMDFRFLNDQILIGDLRKFEVMSFNLETGALQETIKSSLQVGRVSSLQNDRVIVMGLSSGNIFEIYDINTTSLLEEFGEDLIQNQHQNILSLDGWVESLPELNEFVYVPSKASYLYFFNTSGNINRVIRTRDGLEFPESRRRDSEGVMRVIAPRSEVEIRDVQATDQHLLLMGYVRAAGLGAPEIYFIDVYGITGEEYFFSFKLPVNSHKFNLIGDRLFLLEESTKEVKAFDISVQL